MTGGKRPAPNQSPQGAAAETARQGRLEAALRENLRRRKAQQRARTEAAVEQPEGEASDEDGGETQGA